MSEQHMLQQLLGSDYILNWVVGNGGMSTVWLADDVRNQREVAIKVLRPEFSDNVEFLSRFRNEALASENIASDNVVHTYDYREVTDDSGRTFSFIVMEFIRGESLADMLVRKGVLAEDEALDILEQAAHGLARIHDMGLVHRDIKPGNLLITQNGRVKITDFGIAKAAASAPLTRTGMVVGTAQYVSPEQAQGKDVTTATDVYSLGVVGYEMLAGHRPFTGDSSVSVAIAHINQAPPSLPTSISAPTRELIGIALRKEPEHRYPNGAELEHAISAARLGKRPPQPTGVVYTPPVQQTASPTAVTSHIPMSAPMSTVAPAVIDPAPAKKSSGFILGLGLSVLIAAAAVAAIYVYSSGLLSSEPTAPPVTSTTSMPSETRTLETVTVTQEPAPARPAAPSPRPSLRPLTPPSEVVPPDQNPQQIPTFEPTVEEPAPSPTMVLPDPPTTIPSQPPTVSIIDAPTEGAGEQVSEQNDSGAAQ